MASTAPCPFAALSTAKHWAAARCALLLASAPARESRQGQSRANISAMLAGSLCGQPLRPEQYTEATVHAARKCVWPFFLAWITLQHPAAPVPASVSCASRDSAEALGAPLLTRAWKKEWRASWASRAEPAAAGAAARESGAGVRISSWAAA